MFLTLPEWYKDDAVDNVELFQDTGHAWSSKLENKRKLQTWHSFQMMEMKQMEAQKHVLFRSSHLEGRDAGVGAVLVDLIHGSLQSYSLLGQILQVL